MGYEEIIREAFFEELEKLSSEDLGLFFNLEKLSEEQAELLKQAILGQALRSVKGFLSGAPKVVPGVGQIPMNPGLGSTFLSGTGKSLQDSGKLMMTGPKASGFTRAELTAAGLPSAPGVAGRVGGQVVHDIGHHVAHKGPVGNVLNPFGSLVGGASEGLARGVGKELSSAGGRAAPIGRIMQKAAPALGLGGEIGGIAGLGLAAGVPISAAGALGGKAIAFAPGAEDALHYAGNYLAHVGHDVAGTTGGKVLRVAKGALGRLAPARGAVA